MAAKFVALALALALALSVALLQPTLTAAQPKLCPLSTALWGEDVYTSAQPGLVECTHYRDNSCCNVTQEAGVLRQISQLRTLADPNSSGAATDNCCAKLLVRVVCAHMCDPDQGTFVDFDAANATRDWAIVRPTFDLEFCQQIFDECRDVRVLGPVTFESLIASENPGRTAAEQACLYMDTDIAIRLLNNYTFSQFTSEFHPQVNQTHIECVDSLTDDCIAFAPEGEVCPSGGGGGGDGGSGDTPSGAARFIPALFETLLAALLVAIAVLL